jgi:LPXTG-site transpeptidase (sortase) family protein
MRRGTLAVAAAALVLAGCGGAPPTAPAAAPTSRPAPIASPAADDFKSVRTYAAVAAPTRLRIPAIDLSTPPLEELGRAADKSIALPSRPERAGWFGGGPKPGEPGPAVIIGHVDWDHSPAVFFRLRELTPGQSVYVDRADGSTAKYQVRRVTQVSKSDFPTDEVYAPDLEPSLRLITCGGAFDRSTRNYLDNVIVFATPA